MQDAADRFAEGYEQWETELREEWENCGTPEPQRPEPPIDLTGHDEWLLSYLLPKSDPRSVYHAVLDHIKPFRDPVERAAARDALAQAMRLHGVTRLAPAMEEHGVGFENVDGVLYPYVF
jgi:hypothetical protein